MSNSTTHEVLGFSLSLLSRHSSGCRHEDTPRDEMWVMRDLPPKKKYSKIRTQLGSLCAFVKHRGLSNLSPPCLDKHSPLLAGLCVLLILSLSLGGASSRGVVGWPPSKGSRDTKSGCVVTDVGVFYPPPATYFLVNYRVLHFT